MILKFLAFLSVDILIIVFVRIPFIRIPRLKLRFLFSPLHSLTEAEVVAVVLIVYAMFIPTNSSTNKYMLACVKLSLSLFLSTIFRINT